MKHRLLPADPARLPRHAPHRSVALGVLLLALGQAARTTIAQDAPTPQNPALTAQIDWLDQQLEHVRDIRAEFSVVVQPTSPQAAAILRAANQARVREPDHQIISPNAAKAQSYRCRWWRRGIREREERTYASGDQETLLQDGKMAVVYGKSQDRTFAAQLGDATGWPRLTRIQPCRLALEFRDWPLAMLLRDSPNVDVQQPTEGQARLILTAESPGAGEDWAVRLMFDAEHRLMEREVLRDQTNYLVEYSRNELRVCALHTFSDHRGYDDGRGHRVWFPSKAVLRHRAGYLPDGAPVDNFVIEVAVRTLEINTGLDDSLFQAKLPAGPDVLTSYPLGKGALSAD